MCEPGQETAPRALARLTQFDFHPRIAETAGVVLVMFSSAHCGGCRHLRRVLHEVRRSKPAWQLFEVDAGHEAALTSEFEVFHLPTVFLFFQGEFHCELRAEARPAAIRSAVHAALAQPAEEAP
jgi:thioredoxin-like negative regulator of GroEL